MRAFARPFAAALILAALFAPAGLAEPERAPAPEVDDRRQLTGDEIKALMNDADLYGCYVDGRPSWGERTASTGLFYDLLNDAARLGVWAVINDSVCYRYDAGGTFCYTVEESRQGWSFYSTFDGALVAQTFCDDDAAV